MITGMRVGLAVVAGLVVGGATSPLQTVLPGAVSSLANSGAPWVLVAMALVYWAGVANLKAAALGFGVLAAEVVGYYAVSILRGFDQSVAYIVFWLVAALVFGAVGGYAAGLMRDGRPARRLAGLAVPTAVLIGEGVYLATGTGNPENTPYGIGAVAVGVLVGAIGVVWMGRTVRQRLLAPLGMLALSAVVYGGIKAGGAVILAG
jgi:hypothetical protein